MSSEHAKQVLRYLADLAPRGAEVTDVVHRRSEFAFLGWHPELLNAVNPEDSRGLWRRPDVKRLVTIDSLHRDEGLLRVGWLFVVGTIEQDDENVTYCLPLLSVPVRVEARTGRRFRVVYRGDIEMPDQLFDDEAKEQLETSHHPFGGGVDKPDERLLARLPNLQGWVHRAIAAAGLPDAPLIPPSTNPLDIREQRGLKTVAGAALYTARDAAAPNVAGTLLSWVSQRLAGTALDALYGDGPSESGHRDPVTGDTEDETIATTLPLNRSQREAVVRARTERVTAVSGPPGTGKSHLVAAAAVDEIARGNTVLIATQSTHATDVIVDLLERHPGPRYVRFGSRLSRESAASDLGDGLAQPLSRAEYERRLERERSARMRIREQRSSIARLLDRERAFAEALARRDVSIAAAGIAPDVLREDFDLDTARRLLSTSTTSRGLFASWRARRAERKLREACRAEPSCTIDDISEALNAAEDERAVRRGLIGGGLSLDAAWDELEHMESEQRVATGHAIEAVRRKRRNSAAKSTRSVGELASALRAGRVKRRRILRDLAGTEFLDVLPLWIGTLREIDNTLPVTPGLFDVAILDEASQIDQMRSAPALARAKRVVVVGDPRQLRHVSFVSDSDMEEAARRRQLDHRTARLLDVRRNSLFDAAAAVTHVTWLDEHFRSAPHLISFSNRTFYRGRLRLMTQHPSVETRDVIRTTTVPGRRDSSGINSEEVASALRWVENLASEGHTSIGVISPFRAQADAIEESILATYGPEDVERLGLRVGTVHAFQGSEREAIIASLAIGPGETSASLRFVQNPNLFNVLVTRARREMILVTSVTLADLPDGLLAQFLRHAEHAPQPTDVHTEARGWTSDLLSEVRAFGLPVSTDYPVGGWSVDLVVGEGDNAIGVETRVHPDGARTHIEQHLALRRAGWEVCDAFESRWLTDAAGAAEMLSRVLLERDLRVRTDRDLGRNR